MKLFASLLLFFLFTHDIHAQKVEFNYAHPPMDEEEYQPPSGSLEVLVDGVVKYSTSVSGFQYEVDPKDYQFNYIPEGTVVATYISEEGYHEFYAVIKHWDVEQYVNLIVLQSFQDEFGEFLSENAPLWKIVKVISLEGNE